ncbi:MAG: beta-ribofuranosylaminobenzene 5'-phosphate synthase family protein [Gemmatimonadota bacterium]
MIPTPRQVRVEAPSRLQLGLLDLRGDLGRLFGGLGVALERPRTIVEVSRSSGLDVEGPGRERAAEFALRCLTHHGLPGARVRVVEAIPAHSGLGSGTQLALAVAAGLAAVHGLPRDVAALLAATGRRTRSGVGSWTFEGGGLVVDGGHAANGCTTPAPLPPLLARHPLPAGWRCVVVIPPVEPGLSGLEERAAFERLTRPDPATVARISHVVLLGVLPAVVEEDLPGFGRAVTELQRLVGECFAPVQGSTFAGPEVAEVVERLRRAGAAGAGQSSWGPGAYGFVQGDEAADELAARARDWVSPAGEAFATAFDNRGATIRPSSTGEDL